MDMMYIRRKMMNSNTGGGRLLPDGYIQLPYIIGNYTASNIDTGISGDNDNLRFQFCVEVNYFTSYASLFGNYVSETSNCWRVIMATSNNVFYASHNKRANNSSVITCDSSFIDNALYFDLSSSSISLKMNGTTYTKQSSSSVGTANDTNIAIGNSSVSNGSTSSSKRAKWYYFSIYDNGTVIRNYIPCKRTSDDKAGFYDIVNDTFNPSTGRSDFILP